MRSSCHHIGGICKPNMFKLKIIKNLPFDETFLEFSSRNFLAMSNSKLLISSKISLAVFTNSMEQSVLRDPKVHLLYKHKYFQMSPLSFRSPHEKAHLFYPFLCFLPLRISLLSSNSIRIGRL